MTAGEPSVAEVEAALERADGDTLHECSSVAEIDCQVLASALRQAQERLRDRENGVGYLCAVHGYDSCPDCVTDLRAATARNKALREAVNPPDGAFVALSHYMQSDADGVMVTVSRQAVDEAVAWYAAFVAALGRSDEK